MNLPETIRLYPQLLLVEEVVELFEAYAEATSDWTRENIETEFRFYLAFNHQLVKDSQEGSQETPPENSQEGSQETPPENSRKSSQKNSHPPPPRRRIPRHVPRQTSVVRVHQPSKVR